MHIRGVTSWIQNTVVFLTNFKCTHFYRERLSADEILVLSAVRHICVHVHTCGIHCVVV